MEIAAAPLQDVRQVGQVEGGDGDREAALHPAHVPDQVGEVLAQLVHLGFVLAAPPEALPRAVHVELEPHQAGLLEVARQVRRQPLAVGQQHRLESLPGGELDRFQDAGVEQRLAAGDGDAVAVGEALDREDVGLDLRERRVAVELLAVAAGAGEVARVRHFHPAAGIVRQRPRKLVHVRAFDGRWCLPATGGGVPCDAPR